MSDGASGFLRLRDLLLRHRLDYGAACREFSWPKLDQFNWALDYFDAMASGNHQIALFVVDESGVETQVTFAEMAERSNRVANFLSQCQGVRRGDRILVMLGDEVALWEILLASFKIGAVVVPCSMLLTEEDLRDRLSRGDVSHVFAAAAQAHKFDALAGAYTRTVVGGPVEGGMASKTLPPSLRDSRPMGRRSPPIRCFCTSHPAPPAARRWFCTRTRAIPWGPC